MAEKVIVADVIIVGYGLAGATAAITARSGGAPSARPLSGRLRKPLFRALVGSRERRFAYLYAVVGRPC